MIKSYKFILIIQVILLFLLGFFCSGIHNDILDYNLRTLALLVIGFSPSFLLLLSILFQKILVSVINSDSLQSNTDSETKEEKIWQTTFFAYLIFCGVSLLASLGLIFIKSEIDINYYEEIPKMILLLLISITIASFIMAIFIRIKNTIWEVNKIVGILMLVLSAIVFGFSLFVPSVNMFRFQSTEYDEVAASADTTYVEGTEVGDDYEIVETDYYSFNEMDFSDIETGGYFEKYYDTETSENSKSQELLKLFLSKNLNLRDDQYISEIRRAIMYAQHEDEFSEINDIDEEMGRKPEEIRKAFDSYKLLIYAFLNDKIYFDSNLNLIVEALIASHENISQTEIPDETMKKIHTIMNMGYKETFPGEYFESLKPFMSEKVLAPLKQNAQKFESDFEYNYKLNAVWIYSFWGRRFEEKNHDEVFKILQEIQAHYFATR